MSIEAVAQLTGLTEHTLRNWEKRYGFPSPERLPNGYRSYSGAQVALLKKVAALVRRGHRIGDLIRAIREGEELPPSQEDAPPELQAELDRIFDALSRYQPVEADHIVAGLSAILTPDRMLELVHAPLLRRIGDHWATNRLTIAQEHFISAYLRAHVFPFIHFMLPPKSSGKKPITAVAATLSNELHEGGLLVMTAFLRLRGHQVLYLGPNLPAEEVASAMKASQAKMALLSFHDPKILKENLENLAKFPGDVCCGGPALAEEDAAQGAPANVCFVEGAFQQMLDEIIAKAEGLAV